MNKVRH